MKKLGLALGAGSVRGLAEIGVLKVFEKENIPVNYIAGTSIGSLIGAMYCSGITAKELERVALESHWKDLLDFTLPKEGLLKGNKVEKFIRQNIRNKQFSDLNIPLSIISTDLNKEKRIIFNRGDVAKAVRASISAPVFFVPVKFNKMLLVDGAIVDPIPVDVVKEMGADVICAVDVTFNIEDISIKIKHQNKFPETFKEAFIKEELIMIKDHIKKEYKHLPDFILDFFSVERVRRLFDKYSHIQALSILKIYSHALRIASSQLAKEKLNRDYVDVIIKPSLKETESLDFDKMRYCIKQGEIAAKKSVKKIKALLI